MAGLIGAFYQQIPQFTNRLKYVVLLFTSFGSKGFALTKIIILSLHFLPLNTHNLFYL